MHPVIQFAKLEKLLDHMRAGQLSVDKFNYGAFHKITACSTQGCALGECVALWPDTFEFVYLPLDKAVNADATYYGVHNKNSRICDIAAAEEFFGLTYAETEALFMGEELSLAGLPDTPSLRTATLEEVCDRFETFIHAAASHAYTDNRE